MGPLVVESDKQGPSRDGGQRGTAARTLSWVSWACHCPPGRKCKASQSGSPRSKKSSAAARKSMRRGGVTAVVTGPARGAARPPTA